ncbi:hypothetical protein E2C01_091735 [Portunus trituberculatus]|uniref:Uncharacterized protein n=1 Tax=Portunus trituberculatus TaxID=210409 RepID=A0A5B7JPW1_PORTR|nr:hypothetical protein [Portunus trituberculatus]
MPSSGEEQHQVHDHNNTSTSSPLWHQEEKIKLHSLLHTTSGRLCHKAWQQSSSNKGFWANT